MKKLVVLIFIALVCSGCWQKRPHEKKPWAPPRVVSLTPSLTEIVCAIGADKYLVGRTSACDYPPEILKKVPVVGGFGQPSLEKIISVSPSLILETELADESLADKLDSICVHSEKIECKLVDDIPGAISKVGQLLETRRSANELAAKLKESITRLKDEAKQIKDRPSVYVEIWHDPMMSVGKRSFISELVYLAGGKNIGDEVDAEYFKPSSEWVVTRNPDVILCLYMDKKISVKEILARRPGWKKLKAVEGGRIYDKFDHSVVLRPGPRVLKGIEALRAAIRKENE